MWLFKSGRGCHVLDASLPERSARVACLVRVIDSTGGYLEEIRVIACHGPF